MMRKIFFIFLFFLFVGRIYAQEKIVRIDIDGNKIVSNATVISKIKVRAGQDYNENIVNEDVKNLYSTGFFETVQAQKQDSDQGTVVIFMVREKLVLNKIEIVGFRYIRKQTILEAIDINEGSFVDEYKLKETVRKIKDLYKDKGFSQAQITYQEKPIAEGEVEVTFTVVEKAILKVRGVAIVGNESIPGGRILKLMKTRKAWLLNKGIFRKEVLRDDARRVIDFYKLEGFSDVEASIDVEYRLKGVYVTVNIVEGRRYYVGTIEVKGNKDVTISEIMDAVGLKTGSIFSEQAVYMDSSRIREVYVDKGYIFSQVEPLSVFNPKTEKVDITYDISENKIAYIESIDIKGNVKTKDKVIRRQLRIHPGSRFDGKEVRRSKQNLENLGYFEEIRFGTEPGSSSDKVDLVIDVKEAKTGYFSFGGGYSSIDQFVGFVELRQRNFDFRNWSTFTGAGQDISLTASLGNLTQRYQLSFTNPWIFDRPVSFGFDAYKKGHKKDENVGYAYEQEITGGDLRLSKEFNDLWHLGGAYRFENVEITDVVSNASQDLKDEAGTNSLSSVEIYLNYDHRDNPLATLRGVYWRNIFQAFGGPLGGDKDFLKYYGRVSVYVPAINRSVVELRLRAGFANPFNDTDKVPIYERFFAGGAATIRGYQERKVGPIDPSSQDPVGGEAMFVGNLEYTYPVADFLKAAAFFDTGNVWAKNSDFFKDDLFSSIGIGVRVKTPIGPVSVDYGWPMDLEPGEEKKEGRLHFNITRAF